MQHTTTGLARSWTRRVGHLARMDAGKRKERGPGQNNVSDTEKATDERGEPSEETPCTLTVHAVLLNV